MADSDEDTLKNERLLAWLATHGMQVDSKRLLVQPKRQAGGGNGLYTIAFVPPSTALFTLPSTAKMNILTLSQYYSYLDEKNIQLTATQLISLHLFLHRPAANVSSSDPLFGPYISVLPRDFSSHPLAWTIARAMRKTCNSDRLLDILPPATRSALNSVEKRFWDDWRRVSHCMATVPLLFTFASRTLPVPCDPADVASTEDYLWAWLNVNTRCLYDRLKESAADQDNISLCPIFDFANHTWMNPNMKPIPSDAEAWQTTLGVLPDAGSDLTCVTCHEAVQKGRELFLTYGMHPQRTMLAEYGFVNQVADEAFLSGEFPGEVDLQDEVEKLFADKGETGDWMRRILEEEGYWGDWTVHSSPSPAYPSYRLITALRLYHLGSSGGDTEGNSVSAVEAWRDTTLGKRELVSAANEAGWRATLARICGNVVRRAEAGMEVLSHMTQNEEMCRDNQFKWVIGNIRLLWLEEQEVAKAVIESLNQGYDF